MFTGKIIAEDKTCPTDPIKPQRKEITVVGDNVDATKTIKVTGIIVKQNNKLYSIEAHQVIVRSIQWTRSGGAFVNKSEDTDLITKAHSLMPSIPPLQPIKNKIPVHDTSPCDEKVADFVLYITTRASGQILHSDDQDAFFIQECSWLSGMADVTYINDALQDEHENSHRGWYSVINSFVPLAHQLSCDAIWVRSCTHGCSSLAKLGVAWGTNKGWCQVVSYGDITPQNPTQHHVVNN